MTDSNFSAPLHTQNPLGRFSDRAQDYARYRPTYPSEAIATLLSGLGEPASLTAADVGAGTGISARLLGDRGLQVWAIEPNAAMREAAAPHPRVTFQAATAEQTGLPDAAVNLVTCCQAFHWFEPETALAEFCRILKPGGRVALMWNDRALDHPLTERYTALMQRSVDRNIFDRSDRKSGQLLAASPLFSGFQQYSFEWIRHLTLESLLGSVLSSSYAPKQGDRHDQLMADLTELFQQEAIASGDTLLLPLAQQTRLYMAQRKTV